MVNGLPQHKLYRVMKFTPHFSGQELASLFRMNPRYVKNLRRIEIPNAGDQLLVE